jgi:hypothetical protein
MSPLEFAQLPLHDAVLGDVCVSWRERKCVADLSAFVDGLTKQAQQWCLTWTGVEEVVIPKREPWGASNQVNAAREEEGWFVLEMQSGDCIRIAAANVECE